MHRIAAYFFVLVSIVAEGIFVWAWVKDPLNRTEVRVAVLVWPVFMVFLAEALRMSGRPGWNYRERQELLRLQLNLERSETDLERLARDLDRVDSWMAPALVVLLPTIAVAFGISMLRS